MGAVVLASMACSSAALAAGDTPDVGTTGNFLVPATAVAGGTLTPMTSARSGDFICTAAYAPVEATPSDLVIGNCLSGSHLHRTEFDTAAGNDWDGGEVLGDYNGCGWINNSNDRLQYAGSYTACADASRARSTYIYSDATYGQYIWSDGSGNDGMPYLNYLSCPEYANYRPWSSANVETDYLRTAPAQTSGTPRLRIRYDSLYPSTDGSGRYIMARDTTIASGSGDWVFIPVSCLGH